MLNHCYTFNIEFFEDHRGSLLVLDKNITFIVQRIYYY